MATRRHYPGGRWRAGLVTAAGMLTVVGTWPLTLATATATATVASAGATDGASATGTATPATATAVATAAVATAPPAAATTSSVPLLPPIPTTGFALLTIAAEPNPAALPAHRRGAGAGDIEVSVTLSGSTTQTSFLDLYLEPGTMACAASTLAEEARGSAARPTSVNGATIQGPFSQEVAENFNAPGVHRLCGYLTPDSNPSGNESASPSATATLLLTVEREPREPPVAKARQCVVPMVVGLREAAGRRALMAAGCRLGTVRRVASPAAEIGYVISQTPTAGRHVPAGTAVNVVVGARRAKAGAPGHR